MNLEKNLISVLKSVPEILNEFNVLTAMPISELDVDNIQANKCQEINKQLEDFYSQQELCRTTMAMATIQNGGKSHVPIDYFMVKHFLSTSLSLSLLLIKFTIISILHQ